MWTGTGGGSKARALPCSADRARLCRDDGVVVRDDSAMSVFSGDSPDLALLAEDEARMLGRVVVEPAHLLLACSRRGRGRELLAERGVSGHDLHAAIVRADGLGDDLVLGRLPRSRASDRILEQAVALGAERGDRRPGELHILLALAEDDHVRALLGEVGIDELGQLVDERYPAEREPLSDTEARRELTRAALEERSRTARAPVPAFERFTFEARQAIRASAESAAQLEHREVEPFHLLIGCLQVSESFAARVLSELWADGELGPIGEAIDLARRRGPPPSHQATGVFSEVARRVVAEDALKVSYRHGHWQIGTGHLMLAVLDSRDRTTEAMTRAHAQRLARTLTRGLPGGERDDDGSGVAWIKLDDLIRSLTFDFRRILPEGWTIWGSAGDIHLRVPDSRSESDFQIRPGWIVAQPGTAAERLQRVTLWMMERLQAAVMQATGEPWPATPDHQPALAHVQLIDDRFNPTLRLGYGDPDSAVVRVADPDIHLNMMIWSS
jgi:hypothetical protein